MHVHLLMKRHWKEWGNITDLSIEQTMTCGKGADLFQRTVEQRDLRDLSLFLCRPVQYAAALGDKKF